MQGVWVQSLVGELRSHMPQGLKNQNIRNRSNIVTNLIKRLKMVHIKTKSFKTLKKIFSLYLLINNYL